MKISILTLFPDMFDGFQTNSIIKRAIGKQIVEIEIINIRDFTKDPYGRVDTPPIGGGAGLIQKAQPIVDALESIKKEGSYTILTSPRGIPFNQSKAKELSHKDHLIIICGHYEGIDERVNKYTDELVSIGDYILTGGEIPAMAISDSIIRLLEGAISSESLEDESFNNLLLEYPQYTEPRDFRGDKVPDILYSGNHVAIAKWRRKQQLLLTKACRNDLFSQISLSKEDKKLLEDDEQKWEKEAIEKGKKFMIKKER